jgi:hypothetical protein
VGDEGPEWLRELAATVGGAARVALSYRERLYPDRKPTPGSQLEQEHIQAIAAGLDESGTAWGTNVVQVAVNQAVASLAAADDQLLSMQHVLREPLTTFGITTLARGVVEASARAWWLLDPSVDVRSRVARSMTLRLEALWRGRQLEDRLDLARTSAARIDEILAVAPRKNLTVVPERRATPPAIEEALPWGARLYEEILGDKQLGYGVWADFAAVAHGQAGGIVQRLEVVDRATDPASDVQWAQANPLKAMGPALGAAMLAHFQAFGRELELHGWDQSAWKSYTRDAFRVVRRLLPNQ